MSKEDKNWKETPDLPGETEPDLVETMETVFGRRFEPLMHEGEEIGMVMVLGGVGHEATHELFEDCEHCLDCIQCSDCGECPQCGCECTREKTIQSYMAPKTHMVKKMAEELGLSYTEIPIADSGHNDELDDEEHLPQPDSGERSRRARDRREGDVLNQQEQNLARKLHQIGVDAVKTLVKFRFITPNGVFHLEETPTIGSWCGGSYAGRSVWDVETIPAPSNSPPYDGVCVTCANSWWKNIGEKLTKEGEQH